MRSPRTLLRALPLVELGGLLLVALACLVFQLRLPGRFPSEADYRTVADWLRAEARPGDAVLLFPWWTEKARLYLPPELPVYGYLGSDQDDLSAHPRVWVLGQPELPRADVSGFQAAFLPRRTAVGAPRRAGNLELTLYENGRYRPRRFVASEAYAKARVYLESEDGTRQDCPFDGQVHRCPGPPHLYVAPEWREIHYEPRHCLWMHPPGGKQRLVAEFDGVPAGTELRLEGGIIFEYAFPRAPHLSTTHFGVEDAASHEQLLEISQPPGLEGVLKASRVLPMGDPRTVKVWVQADNPDTRQVCLDVFALGDGATVSREGT
ncbi:hypothetical protein [Vitiosangium sp. GDMCC 1.1324]|uniref:hypothetical protein n=1 Tax=Vitiosangium sp. (strain GDMCC 1.1324) TaxID=2138576 RepID=UPI000D33227A|nr:hypothetical protein [Vitiosangium sp. GDMCC 1.1324]PTL77754.1 hypothetical protein DAT35_41845 [Vitiosangium sp. GDMCC 1.1324]